MAGQNMSRIDEIRERWAKAPEIDEENPRIIMINRAIWDEALTHAPTDISDLLSEMERLQDTVADISSWAYAYPVKVFTEPTKEELAEVTDKIGGNMVTKLHGSWGRHILEGVRKIIEDRE